MTDKIPTYSPDADTAGADWIKMGWDFPPYGSREFLEQIGGPGNLPQFRRSPACAGAVSSGLIHDDEWVADWVEPKRPSPDNRAVHVHLHKE